MPPDVTLGELGAEIGATVIGSADVPVDDVTHDSRRVRPGTLFVAVRGFSADGHEFIPAALAGGAAALCVEVPVAAGIPQMVVEDTRAALPQLAAAVHHHPSRSLEIVGITGTNGKTTVTYLLQAIFEAAGIPSALIGTIGARIGRRPVPIGRTTPESSDLQRLLAEMLRSGVRAVAVEVSSHALALGRVDATTFAVAAFTNLTQDHLDFHGDMETYFEAKASLFVPDRARQAVVWVDDPYGRRLADSAGLPVLRVGGDPESDVHARDVILDTAGARFTMVTPRGSGRVHLPLVGEFNVANALVAGACATALQIDPAQVCEGLGRAEQIPGRFERIDEGQPYAVVVDYAHTPEGISAAITAARAATSGDVVAVIGAGGDRDRAKRPLMGAAAAPADRLIVTSDNPRSEHPLDIIADVVSGVKAGITEVTVIPNRREAIAAALAGSHPGDVVLILGKGHEQGQEFADRIEPFDDRVVARDELRRLEVRE